jgi:hypothetical protein
MRFIDSESAMLCGVQDRFYFANTMLVYLAEAENCKISHFSAENKRRK